MAAPVRAVLRVLLVDLLLRRRALLLQRVGKGALRGPDGGCLRLRAVRHVEAPHPRLLDCVIQRGGHAARERALGHGDARGQVAVRQRRPMSAHVQVVQQAVVVAAHGQLIKLLARKGAVVHQLRRQHKLTCLRVRHRRHTRHLPLGQGQHDREGNGQRAHLRVCASVSVTLW